MQSTKIILEIRDELLASIKKVSTVTPSFFAGFRNDQIVIRPMILDQTSSLTGGNRLSLSSICPKKATGRLGFAMVSHTEKNRIPQSVRSHHTIALF